MFKRVSEKERFRLLLQMRVRRGAVSGGQPKPLLSLGITRECLSKQT